MSAIDEKVVAEIQSVQKIMRRAENSASYNGGSDGPTENIGPWERTEKAVSALSGDAKTALEANGFAVKDGWLHGQDGVAIRSHQLDRITATADLPREVTVQGVKGRPDFKLTADVRELPNANPEHRFMAVVKRDGVETAEAGNRISVAPTREEAMQRATILLRNRIEDNFYKIVPQSGLAPERQEQRARAARVAGESAAVNLKPPSVFSRIADAASRAVDRVRFEMSFPSREARAYFEGSHQDFQTVSAIRDGIKAYKPDSSDSERAVRLQASAEKIIRNEIKNGGAQDLQKALEASWRQYVKNPDVQKDVAQAPNASSSSYERFKREAANGDMADAWQGHEKRMGTDLESAKTAVASNRKQDVSANYWMSLADVNPKQRDMFPSQSLGQSPALKM